ncbi:unnamed protein product [Durusdinium trenchii]|uniref:Smr domain-containing protein n=1 Tax=Durusdinium trenchii TaxID=1381693 RepID=A0ABP0S527_9DINO
MTYVAFFTSKATHAEFCFQAYGEVLFKEALERKIYELSCDDSTLDLHRFSAGAASLAVRQWLATPGLRRVLITGHGKMRGKGSDAPLQSSVLALLKDLQIPAEVDDQNFGRIQLVALQSVRRTLRPPAPRRPGAAPAGSPACASERIGKEREHELRSNSGSSEANLRR